MKAAPGLGFSIVCDLGFAVGLMTHRIERIGSLIWLAEQMFDDEPTLEQVRVIEAWRWPIFFPLGAALHRKICTPIGIVPIPDPLREFPIFRSRNGSGGWNRVRFVDGSSQPVGPTNDRVLPIYSVVNDTRLKEMLVTGWRPEQNW